MNGGSSGSSGTARGRTFDEWPLGRYHAERIRAGIDGSLWTTRGARFARWPAAVFASVQQEEAEAEGGSLIEMPPLLLEAETPAAAAAAAGGEPKPFTGSIVWFDILHTSRRLVAIGLERGNAQVGAQWSWLETSVCVLPDGKWACPVATRTRFQRDYAKERQDARRAKAQKERGTMESDALLVALDAYEELEPADEEAADLLPPDNRIVGERRNLYVCGAARDAAAPAAASASSETDVPRRFVAKRQRIYALTEHACVTELSRAFEDIVDMCWDRASNSGLWVSDYGRYCVELLRVEDVKSETVCRIALQQQQQTLRYPQVLLMQQPPTQTHASATTLGYHPLPKRMVPLVSKRRLDEYRHRPYGICQDAHGTLYMSDSQRHTIYRVDPLSARLLAIVGNGCSSRDFAVNAPPPYELLGEDSLQATVACALPFPTYVTVHPTSGLLWVVSQHDPSHTDAEPDEVTTLVHVRALAEKSYQRVQTVHEQLREATRDLSIIDELLRMMARYMEDALFADTALSNSDRIQLDAARIRQRECLRDTAKPPLTPTTNHNRKRIKQTISAAAVASYKRRRLVAGSS